MDEVASTGLLTYDARGFVGRQIGASGETVVGTADDYFAARDDVPKAHAHDVRTGIQILNLVRVAVDLCGAARLLAENAVGAHHFNPRDGARQETVDEAERLAPIVPTFLLLIVSARRRCAPGIATQFSIPLLQCAEIGGYHVAAWRHGDDGIPIRYHSNVPNDLGA